MLQSELLRSFSDEVSHAKVAATRQVKEIRKLLRQGKTEEAERLAKKLHQAGVLKVTDLGTQLKGLGSGAEGVAHQVIGAKDAPTSAAVRKMYDPGGPLFSPEIVRRKVEVGKAVREDPRFAKMLSDAPIQAGKSPGHLMEFVPGEAVGMPQPAHIGPGIKTQFALRRGKRKSGFNLTDVMQGPFFHPENVRVTPEGAHKIIDYIPQTDQELGEAARALQGALSKDRPLEVAAHWQARGMKGATPEKLRALMLGEGTEGQAGRIFKELGPGSRQAKKVRGAKIPAERLRFSRPASTPLATSSSLHGGLQHLPHPTTAGRLSLALPLAAGAVGLGALGLGGYLAAKKFRKTPSSPSSELASSPT